METAVFVIFLWPESTIACFEFARVRHFCEKKCQSLNDIDQGSVSCLFDSDRLRHDGSDTAHGKNYGGRTRDVSWMGSSPAV